MRMKVNVQRMNGTWDLGYSLDKHTEKSEFKGYDPNGNPMFDTIRTEAGEALYQLKYRHDFTWAPIIAQQMVDSFTNIFFDANFIIPMPSSKEREKQPVSEIANSLADLMNITCLENVLIKKSSNVQLKDLDTVQDKEAELQNALTVNDQLFNGNNINVLIVDDIFDTGTSLNAATNEIRKNPRVNQIYIAVVTRKRNG